MQRGLQRYWRRPRGWLDESSDAGGSRMARTAETDGLPRGRRHRQRFPEHLESTCHLVGYGEEDEALVQRTRGFIRPHVDEIAGGISRELRSHPETADYFAKAAPSSEGEQVGLSMETFKEWLASAVDDELDATTADYLASFGHAQVRPRNESGKAMKARFFVLSMSRVQCSLIAILSANIADPAELGACAAAWSKRLWIHLDLLFAVYSATEGSPHWY